MNKMLWVVILLFLISFQLFAQTTSEVTFKNLTRTAKWMFATDMRTFGVSDQAKNFVDLKVFYKLDHRFVTYLYGSRFIYQTDQGSSKWTRSGIGLNYYFLGPFSSSPYLKIQSQNVESEMTPYRDLKAITSYGVGYNFLVGKLNFMANVLMNVDGFRVSGTKAPLPYEFMPLATVVNLELGYFF